MIIYKSLYKPASLQIIRSITINNKNLQKLSLCYDVDFFKCGRPEGGAESENLDTYGYGGGGKRWAKICGCHCPYWMASDTCTLIEGK